jgi:hypothetical protein
VSESINRVYYRRICNDRQNRLVQYLVGRASKRISSTSLNGILALPNGMQLIAATTTTKRPRIAIKYFLDAISPWPSTRMSWITTWARISVGTKVPISESRLPSFLAFCNLWLDIEIFDTAKKGWCFAIGVLLTLAYAFIFGYGIWIKRVKASQ